MKLHLPGARRWPKLYRYGLRLLLAGGTLISAVALFVYLYGQADRAAPADVIIVLGAGTRADGTPNRGQIRRVRHGVALYKQGIAPYLLCTGGYTNNHPRSEAQTCIDLASALGVPATALLREDVSTTTQENVIESRRVMNSLGLQRAVVVSDNYHLFRAEWLFHVYGVSVSLSPAQATEGALSIQTALLGTYREVGALVWNGLRLILAGP